MGNANKGCCSCNWGPEEPEIKSQLDYVMSKWDLTRLKDIITPENQHFYHDLEDYDYILRCKFCGFEEIVPAHRIMGMHNCSYCCDLAEHLASHSFGCLEKVKYEDIQSALDEFRDFYIDIQDSMLKELEIPQRTDLIPRFECLTEVLCSLEIIGPGIKFYYEYLFRKAHQLAIALIIDLSAWIQETEHLVGADGPDYPLPWRNDSSNQISIERALSTLENLRRGAIIQKLWVKDETGFRGPSQSDLLLIQPFASELFDRLLGEE